MESDNKPGWMTSEMWLTVVVSLPSLVAALTYIYQSGALEEGSIWHVAIGAMLAALAALPVAGYAISRGMVKQARIKADASVEVGNTVATTERLRQENERDPLNPRNL